MDLTAEDLSFLGSCTDLTHHAASFLTASTPNRTETDSTSHEIVYFLFFTAASVKRRNKNKTKQNKKNYVANSSLSDTLDCGFQ